MEELKGLKVEPLKEDELKKVAGGEEGELPQIRLYTSDGHPYQCACGCLDFWVIGNTPTQVRVRCMNCGREGCVSQTR